MNYPDVLLDMGRPASPMPVEQKKQQTFQMLEPIFANFAPRLFQITGSKGKSTVASFIAQLLPRSGLFTSPHVVSVRERIRINNEPISELSLARHYAALKPKWDAMLPYPGFFHKSFVTACAVFAEESVESLVAEVGIGGATDQTEVLNRLCRDKTLLVTKIEREHTAALGSSLYEIAVHKALLADRDTKRIVISPENALNEEVMLGLSSVFSDYGLVDRVVVADGADIGDIHRNMARLATGVQDTSKLKELECHHQVIKVGDRIAFLDGAHTISSVRYAVDKFKLLGRTKPVVVFGRTKDRDFKAFLSIINELEPAKILVLPGSETLDLAYGYKPGDGDIRACKEVFEWLKQTDTKTELITNIQQLKEYMRGNDVFTSGSSHSAGVVAAVLKGIL